MADTLGFSHILDSDQEDDPVMKAAKMAADEADRQAQRRSSETYQYGDPTSELGQPGDEPYDVEGGRAKDEAERRKNRSFIGDDGTSNLVDPFHSSNTWNEDRAAALATQERTGQVVPINQRPAPTNPVQTQAPSPAGSRTARDGQTLAQQSYWTQTAFRHQYGERAEEEWVRQHEAELDRNVRLYGAQEPRTGTAPVSGAPAGTPHAPERRINATPPPASSGGVVPTAAPSSLVTPQTAPTPGAPGTAAPTPAVSSAPATGAPDAPTTLGARPTAPSTGDQGVVGAAPPTTSAAPAPTPPPGMPPMPVGGEDLVYAEAPATGARMWRERSDVQAKSNTYRIIYDPKATGAAPVASAGAPTPARMSARTGPAPVPDDPVLRATAGDKPIDTLVSMAGKPPEESRRVLQGIGALLKGDASASWAEPYLNDTARLAWAKQEQAQGKNVDPRDAPQDYIESWKDAFFGSDPSVPFVKELDQQMIDHAVDISGGPAQGRPFNWKEAFGPTGEGGLISRQVASNDCGPNAASVVLRSYGYNVDPAQMFEYAKAKGYHDGEQFTGPNNMARMLTQEAGLSARAAPIDWGVIDQELDQGHVVLLSSGGHYWAVSARRDGPNGPEYYAGATASVVGNPDWARPGALRWGGAPNTMILTAGQVDPNAPVVATLGLKPPVGTGGPDRSVLSLSTRERMAQRITSDARRNGPQGANQWSDIAWNLAREEGADPVLVQAVMGQESGGDPNTPDSYAGARGPMQLMPATAAELGVNRDDPVDNTRGGIRYLKQMLDRYHGDLRLALAAYNAGPGAVDASLAASGDIPHNGETEYYVPAVLGRYQSLLNSYQQRGR